MAEDDGGRALFPATRLSAFALLQSPAPADRERGLDCIAAAYWRPVYVHVRIKWRKQPEEARDLTQGFFTSALEKRLFDGYERDRGRFRSFLRTCLDRFLANEHEASVRLKRGGPRARWMQVELDDMEPEVEALVAGDDPETAFDREWTRSIFALSVDDLRREYESLGKAKRFEVFERLVLGADDSETYRQIAERLGIRETDVSNYLTQTKRDLRRILLERLRGITSSDEELADEARAVLAG
jgi:RNA polymerase sigma factor (sigma-70 family)